MRIENDPKTIIDLWYTIRKIKRWNESTEADLLQSFWSNEKARKKKTYAAVQREQVISEPINHPKMTG
jgi:hypothetical protein